MRIIVQGQAVAGNPSTAVSRITGGVKMKYIVFKYTDTDTLYAVPESDGEELQRIDQLMVDYPGRMQKIGTLETETAIPQWLQYFAVPRKPERTSPVIQLLKCRNADIIFG